MTEHEAAGMNEHSYQPPEIEERGTFQSSTFGSPNWPIPETFQTYPREGL